MPCSEWRRGCLARCAAREAVAATSRPHRGAMAGTGAPLRRFGRGHMGGRQGRATRPDVRKCITACLAHNVERGMNILGERSEEHTSEIKSLMRIAYDVFCLE